MCRVLRGTFVSVAAPVVIALAVLAVGAGLAGTAPEIAPARWWPSFGCYDAPVVAVGRSGVAGGALLCIVDDGVRPSLSVQGLRPGRTYTAWLSYAGRPATCRLSPCAGDDLLGLDRVDNFGQFDAGPAKPDGTAYFRGHVSELSPTSGSEVTLVLGSQGAEDGSTGRPGPSRPFTLPDPESGRSEKNPEAQRDLSTLVAYATFRLP